MKEYEYSFKVCNIKPYIKYCETNNYKKKKETSQKRVLYTNNSKIMARITTKESNGNKEIIYRFFSSSLGETKSGDIHIHLSIINTDRYNEFIILRNYLLNNEEEANNYSKFKKKIINVGILDRKEYKRIKSEYVNDLIERAKEFYKLI